VRLVEVRLLDGPNLYRLEPTVRIEVTVGRRRTWYGDRLPARHALVRLSAAVPPSQAPRVVGAMTRWVRRLHRRGLGQQVPVSIHRTSEPGHWIVAFPWREAGRAELIANAAFRLADEPGRGERLFERALRRLGKTAAGPAPEWQTDAERQVPIISISGTNGKSTTTRMIAHIARVAGRHVGMTTTDGVLVDDVMIEPGDFTGPAGAKTILERSGVDLAVLETARGGILLRGLGYQSNDASVLTNVSGDHLDLQGVHTLPELAEVKSVICRVTRPDGAVVLNADDSLIAAVARRVAAPVYLFSLKPRSARIRRHLERGGRAYVLEADGWMVEVDGHETRRIVRAADVRATIGGLARHNIANALAAAGGARALGFSIQQVAAGLRDVRNSPDQLPGRLNVHRLGNRLLIVDYAHNVAGLDVLLATAEALVGRRGKRRGTLTVIVGTAGDRPDDYIRSLAFAAGSRADQVAIKESIPYLRGRSRASVTGELREGLRAAGVTLADVPVYDDELEAIRGELTTPGRLAATDDGTPRVIVAMSHRLREEIGEYLDSAGAQVVDDVAQIADLRELMSAGDGRPPRSSPAPRHDRPASRTRRRSPRSAA